MAANARSSELEGFWAVVLGLGMVQSDCAQIGVDIFGERIPKAMLRLRAVVMDLLAFAFVAAIATSALKAAEWFLAGRFTDAAPRRSTFYGSSSTTQRPV